MEIVVFILVIILIVHSLYFTYFQGKQAGREETLEALGYKVTLTKK